MCAIVRGSVLVERKIVGGFKKNEKVITLEKKIKTFQVKYFEVKKTLSTTLSDFTFFSFAFPFLIFLFLFSPVCGQDTIFTLL